MCDARPASAARPCPRWRRLYAIVTIAVAAGALNELWVQARPLRIALGCGIAAASWAVTVMWIRANRVALDQLEWCDCAVKTITVRVVLSRPAPPVATGATLRVCAET